MKKILVKFYDGSTVSYEMKNRADHMQYFNRFKRIADTITLKQNGETVVLKR